MLRDLIIHSVEIFEEVWKSAIEYCFVNMKCTEKKWEREKEKEEK